jgi:pseudouridylate synthase
MFPNWLTVSAEVQVALRNRTPVVALESTLIAHGLPRPTNLETARQCEAVIRELVAVPATIAILHGKPVVGLSGAQLEELASADDVYKVSRRDLAPAIALNRIAGTTVSATMALAHAAGIRVFATGGIGGAHRESDFDISADLTELARTPVLVVCSGAKSILDLNKTLEILETLGVPVLGYQTEDFPTFYTAGSCGRVSARVNQPSEVAAVFQAHLDLGGGGVVLAQPCPVELAVPAALFNSVLTEAELDAADEGVSGAKLTPYLLARLSELTNGKTLAANRALIVQNAKLAAEVAIAMRSHTGP